jgi:lipopolysaccharide transport system permease protein
VPRYSAIAAEVQGRGIRVQFELVHFQHDSPCVVGWQIYDPSSDAFLFEGEWQQLRDGRADVDVTLPEEDGPYRVQIAPVEHRDQFIVIEARVSDGAAVISPPKIGTASALKRARAIRAIPKAFVYPPQTLWRNRKLIRSMVRRDILARYRGSFGGALWTFLNPLLLMATYAFVFGAVLKTRFGADATGTGYVLYFLAGMLPWLAFSEAVGRSPYVILEHRNFVKKLVFPLETLPPNLVISGLVTEVFGLAIFIIGLLAIRHALPVSIVWLPALLIPQLLLTAGICWFLAALGIFLRDLGQIMGFVLTLWFFLTPICYSESILPEGAKKLLVWNPVYHLVSGYRSIFLEGRAPDLQHLAILWIASAAIAVCGHAWFHRLRRSFADVI